MLRRTHRFSFAIALGLAACTPELDESKPAPDPLEDPWVNGIDTGDEGELAPQPAGGPSTPESVGARAEPSPPSSDPAPMPGGLAQADLRVIGGPKPASAADVALLDGPKPSSDSAAAMAAGAPASSGPAEASAPPSAALDLQTDEGAQAVELAAPVEPTKPAGPAPITLADFHGEFRYTGGSSQREALTDAIDEAVGQLAAIIRGIGRKRLTKTNPISSSLKLLVSNDKVQTLFDTGFDPTCVVDGATITWKGKGDTYRVRVRRNKNKLIQVIQGSEGVKTSVFVLSSDRQRLTVHHKITADKLPVPLTYKLSYTRK